MPEKRGNQFNHFGGGQGQPLHKKHRGNDINHQRAPYSPHQAKHGDARSQHSTGQQYARQNGSQQFYRKEKNNEAVIDRLQRLPEPKDCSACIENVAEMQTGLISMLDRLAQEEMGEEGDREVLVHARELHRLLSARPSISTKAKQELDVKRPDKEKYITLPAYVARKIRIQSELPPLPPITEIHLQEAVFTHRSVHPDTNVRGFNAGQLNYEKLEFLGDAYIEVVATRILYSRFPHLESGQQAHFRESLVNNENLARFAEAYSLNERIAHGSHMDKESKGWTKIVADVFEAYVAAIVLSDPEHGFETAETWLTELWTPQLLSHKETLIQDPRARDQINKLLLFQNAKLDYREEREMEYRKGAQHYFMGLYLTGWGYENKLLGNGEGQSKGAASAFAAMDALEKNVALLAECNAKKLEAVGLKRQKMEAWQKEHGIEQKTDDKDGKKEASGKSEDTESKSGDDDMVEAMAKQSKKHARQEERPDTNGEILEKKKKKSKKEKRTESSDT